MSPHRENKVVAIAAGGTGGHLFPGIALAQALKRRGVDSHFILGTPRGEDRWLNEYGFEYTRISSTPLFRNLSIRTVNSSVKNIIAVKESLAVIHKLKPDIAVGMGAYTSGPFLISCYLSSVPFVLFEQNLIPGLTNKMLAPLSLHTFVTFEGTKLRANSIHVVGNLIRDDVKPKAKSKALKKLGLKGGRPVLVVIGGSQGAATINRTLIDAFNTGWGKDYSFVIQTGIKDYEYVSSIFREKGIEGICRDFFDDMGAVYGAGDLYIGRSGGGIFEALLANLPLVLIPYPFASGDHQRANAEYLEKKGSAVVIDENDLNAEVFMRTVDALTNDKDRMRKMAENSKGLAKHDASDVAAGIILEEMGVK